MTAEATPHFHRCKQCRERMDHGCIDQSCTEGYGWVILCLRCYEGILLMQPRPA